MRKIGWSVLVLVVAAGIGWWAIGPQWRLFLSDPPSDTNVLFWTQSQRDAGFALSDRIPTIDTRPIAANGTARPLPDGPPLALDVDIDAFMAAQNSAAVLILHKGKLRLERYGLHQDRDARWTSFSVAKSVTSTLVGAAIRDGYIGGLDDKVSDYVAGLKGSAYDNVSIRQLLTMTSGVRWLEDYADPQSDVALFRSVEPVAGEASLVTYMKRLPRAHPPGEVFNYSTGETNLVGVLVSEAVGMGVAAYLSQVIWTPYGMEHDGSWVTSSTGEEISGCCIQATARDYARFGQFVLEDGRIGDGSPLRDGWIAEATGLQQPIPDDDGRDYGYQWWILDQGTFAAIGIFGQSIFVDPGRELVTVTHASWQDSRGKAAGQSAGRSAFWDAVQAAIDAE
ncbi:serine hydrolase domain-containing protein [Pseudaestuariivita atlantica]|uniref:Beta-lactamase n=1 Tax=Pseudaestuariivita atlantica TaxID=1317121 RepID=A0A0L1JR04_9RHOB|nr:serine hydrolase domain-containing protein [Pseudaestuariivita atlantica]KNG94166.1 beta-lactamase [Pseudaestuariivita atlantica]